MTTTRILRPRPVRALPETTGRSTQPAAWPVRDEILTFHDVVLERGDRLDLLDVHYRLEGEIAPARDNVVLVVHALTGNVRASEWWRGVVGEGEAIDPTRHAVLTANLLGGCDGTTGPSNEHPDVLPPFTTRDQAAVLARLLNALGIKAPLLICGGSLGGQVTLEFAASFPNRTRAAVVLAAPAAQTAQGLAWNVIMRRAIAIGGVTEGLALARMVGMLSYRTPEALERRFGRARSANDTYLVNDWLDTHGDKLVARFDATSYGTLLDVMDTHDVGRDRGGIAAALAPVADRLTGVGIPGDLLYPAETVREWADAAGARYVDLPSVHGHDAFLLEAPRVSAILREAIARVEATATNHVKGETTNDATHRVTPARTSLTSARHQPPTTTQPAIAPPLPLRIALAGCGHVGGNLLDLLVDRNTRGTAQPVRVQRVLVRDAHRPRPALAHAIAGGLAPQQACITDPTELLDDDVDVLVEAIGGTTTARTLVETALRRGIRVVTANKALLAERGPQLLHLAQLHGTRLDFEGAVAGAIPVVRCVRSGAAGVGITSISGILNGTSNFVLERVAEGASLHDAVRLAQQHGFAEADPSRDLSGEDAEDKLRVLAWLVFGVDPSSVKVVRRGIDEETAAWAAHVAAEGDRVKLIASCTLEHGTLAARIIPTRITRDDAWASVSGASNRVVIESASAGALVFHGPGAGGRATAGAVLSDIVQ